MIPVFLRPAIHTETQQQFAVFWEPDRGFWIEPDLIFRETLFPGIDEDEALAKATHRHYKGGLYRFLDVIHQSNDDSKESLVLYEHLWPHVRGLWLRPVEMFFSNLVDGQPRFKKLGVDSKHG